MNANETELILDATLAIDQDEIDLELEANCVPVVEWTRKNRNMYLGKLRILGTIHAEIANELDKRRKIVHEAFFMPEDKWLPASHEKDLLVRFALGRIAQADLEAQTMPSEA